jgi:hypothetical protein
MNPYSQYGSPYSNKSWSNPYATDAPWLFDSQGQFQHELPYDPDSTSNPYGRYSSPYSPDSIRNPMALGIPTIPTRWPCHLAGGPRIERASSQNRSPFTDTERQLPDAPDRRSCRAILANISGPDGVSSRRARQD